jgi:hypothetical protein
MALLTKLNFRGKVDRLLRRPDRESGFVKSETGALRLTFAGPADDCHTGLTRKSDSRTLPLYKRDIDIRNVRQLTLLSVEELTEIATRVNVPEIKPEWFGANIVTIGIPDLTLLPPSTRLQFSSGATVVVDMENLPCKQIAEVVSEHYPETRLSLVPAAMHKRGVTAWVEREGEVRIGDEITLVIPPQRHYAHGLPRA